MNPTAKFLSALLLVVPLVAVAADRQVSVTGLGEVSAKPDSARVNLSVKSVRRESTAAKDEVDTRVNAFLEALDDLGFAEDDITAGTLRTNPRYDYRSGEQVFAGYQASRVLTVMVKDLEDLEGLLDTALAQGIDSVNQIEYQVSDPSALERRARELAIEHSKQQAMELAQAYGAELGPISSINYRSQQVRPVFMEAGVQMAFRTAAADAGPVGQYLPEQITFSDQIDVVFDLIISE